MVGLPLEQAFESTFGDLDLGTREALLVACAEAGHAQLDRHGATLLAGVEETLADLSARGVRLGIASNCSPEYLELMLTRAGLERWIEEGRCLASPGVRDKGDMIVVCGTPEEVAEHPTSHTGRYLRKALAQHPPAAADVVEAA